MNEVLIGTDFSLYDKKGSDLLSHINAVPSAQLGLTTLFGMGRGEPQCYNHPKRLVISYWCSD